MPVLRESPGGTGTLALLGTTPETLTDCKAATLDSRSVRCMALFEQERKKVAAERAEKERLDAEYAATLEAAKAEAEKPLPPMDAIGEVPADGWGAIINEAAAMYGVSASELYAVMMCESGGDPNAYNDTPVCGAYGCEHAQGLMQFLPSTWAGTPYANESIYDGRASIFAAAWKWANGGRGEWAC